MSRLVIFIDDARTFGGAQIALGRALRALVHGGERVVCITTAATWERIGAVATGAGGVRFVECPPSLPLNLFAFPIPMLEWRVLLWPLLEQAECEWWMNLASVEFCLAPLWLLRRRGIAVRAWLHNSERGVFFCDRGWRGALAGVRDALAERYVLPAYSRIATPGRAAEVRLRERMKGTSRTATACLYPLGEETPTQSAERGDALELAFIGRLERSQKNPLAAVEVLAALVAEGRESRLTVVGDGAEREAMEQRARALGVQGRVRWLGWQGDPWREVPANAVLLMPSRYEGTPLVVLEALARGVRMVGAPIAALQENLPAAMVAAENAVAALAAKVLEVAALEDEAVRALYGPLLARSSELEFLKCWRALSGDAAAKAMVSR